MKKTLFIILLCCGSLQAMDPEERAQQIAEMNRIYIEQNKLFTEASQRARYETMGTQEFTDTLNVCIAAAKKKVAALQNLRALRSGKPITPKDSH